MAANNLKSMREVSSLKCKELDICWLSNSKKLQESVHTGLSYRPHKNRNLSVRTPYRTGLFLWSGEGVNAEPIFGRGWHIDFRFAVDVSGTIPAFISEGHMTSVEHSIGTEGGGELIRFFVPEILIFADNQAYAESLSKDLYALSNLISSRSPNDFEEARAVEDDMTSGGSEQARLQSHLFHNSSFPGLLEAASLLPILIQDKILRQALWRYVHAQRIIFHHPLDFAPSYPGYWPSFTADNSTDFYIAYALAITSAFSVVEEFDCDPKIQLFVEQKINDQARDQVRTKLKKAKIDPDTDVIWLRRGGRSQIDKLLPLIGRKADWFDGRVVRDRLVSLVDGIILAKALRNKAGSHGTSRRTKVLRAHDLENTLQVARALLRPKLKLPTIVSENSFADYLVQR